MSISTGAIRPPTGFQEALSKPLILASASPRRRDIMRQAGLPFVVRTSAAEQELDTATSGQTQDGSGMDNTDTAAACFALNAARLKAVDVAGDCPGWLVIGADTVVSVDSHLLGKPVDDSDAARMLGLLSGRSHQVITALVIAYSDGSTVRLASEDYVTSVVIFRPLSDQDIRQYVESGEPTDKAGAYAIQGLGGSLVDRIEGSYLNIVGLPVDKLVAMLHTLGWSLQEAKESQLSDEVH